jgi:hypothetical protein
VQPACSCCLGLPGSSIFDSIVHSCCWASPRPSLSDLCPVVCCMPATLDELCMCLKLHPVPCTLCLPPLGQRPMMYI